MTIGRSQIPEQIDAFEEGGDASSATQEYISQLKKLYANKPDVDFESVQGRAEELGKFFPAPRKASIFDLASALSQGLAANAQNARPTPIGYGLAAGFNLFSEQERKRRAEADRLKRDLILMAKKEAEAKAAQDMRLVEMGLDAELKLKLEQIKKGQDVTGFTGGGLKGSAMNIILQAATDPSKLDTPEFRLQYELAKEELQRTTIQPIQTETGTRFVEKKGMNVADVFNRAGVSDPMKERTKESVVAPTDIPAGYEFTGKTNAQGKAIVTKIGGNPGDPDYALVAE